MLIPRLAVKADEINQIPAEKKQINLKEIILDTEQNPYLTSNTIIAGDTAAATEKTAPEEISTKCKCTTPKKKERKIFGHLNPIVPVIKLNKVIESGVKGVDGITHFGLDKLDGRLFSGVKKIDKTIDTGVGHLEGAVDKGLGNLDETFDKGLGSIDKVLNAGIEKTTVQEWLDGDYATGKYFGARPNIESHGVSINSSLLYSPFVKTGGGANERSSAKGYSVFNLGITVDTEKAGLWKGGTAFALYQRKNGYGVSGPDGAMGDWMGFDGWDWHQMSQMSEYWYQQKFFGEKLRMKFGKQDSNTDFGYLNSGWDFMNSAFSVNPTTPLPTYPDQPFGFMAAISPKEWVTIKDGIYSRYGSPFNVTEVEFKPTIKDLPGRYLIGAWEMSDREGISAATGMNNDGSTYFNNFNRNFGFYISFEQMLYKEKKDDKNDMQGLVAFGQLGMSPSDRNDMSKYVGGGLHYLGPIPKRDKDIAGVAVGSGNFSSRLGNVGSDYGTQVGSETAVEVFYRLQISPWFYLQPDVQLIMNPSGMYGNSVAIGLRSVITF